MIFNYLSGLFGLGAKNAAVAGGGLPTELRFPVFIAGDGGSGRTSALGEIARRASVDRRVMITFSVKDHLPEGASAAQRDGVAQWFVRYIEAVAQEAIARIVVLIDDIDCFDQDQVSRLLILSADADVVCTSSGHFLAKSEAMSRHRVGSVVALRTSTPALSARLDAEGAPIAREQLATLALGQSYQVELASGRVSFLTWPGAVPLDA